MAGAFLFKAPVNVIRWARKMSRNPYKTHSIPRLTSEARKPLSVFNQGFVCSSTYKIEVPGRLNRKIRRLMNKQYNLRTQPLLFEETTRIPSLSTTRVRQRLCNLMGTDVIRLNDKRYFQKLSDRLQEEYETVMDKEEEARAASENERLRRLMLEGVIKNPHDYRAIIHGEHHKHKHSKKKKRRSKRKKQIEPEREIEEGSATTLTPQASEEESESQEQKDEVVTQVEILSRPGSSLASRAVSRDKRVSSARTRRSPSGGRSRTEESRLVEEQGEEEENDQEKRFSEMHVPPPHRPSSSCSLRRKRLKSASARVSHWDESRESEESSEEETEEETRSLPDTRRSKNYWKYSKTEKPLVLTLRREETVEGLYSIAEQLISPKKAEESYDKKGKRAY